MPFLVSNKLSGGDVIVAVVDVVVDDDQRTTLCVLEVVSLGAIAHQWNAVLCDKVHDLSVRGGLFGQGVRLVFVRRPEDLWLEHDDRL
jgi:hypothetical protein